MNDKPFMDKLAAQKKSRQVVMQRHAELRRVYEAALKEDPKGEKPETQDLKKKLDALTAEYQGLRQATLKTVSDRLNPKKAN